MKNDEQEKLRHSLAHLLAAAVLDLHPEALATIGPAIENGFYYDFDNINISDKDLPKIEKRMREILPGWSTFEKIDGGEEKARALFKNNPYKMELIEEIKEKGERITLYKSGDFVDLCRGGHIESAKTINPEAFKLQKIAGAYWRGNEKNKMLVRIYGLAFDTSEELQKYEKMLEEAVKRDHKKLGTQLDLFTFSELVGGGLPLWTPKGTLLRDILDDFVWELRKKRGYQRVDIPHLAKKDLYIKSGHWNKFSDELLKINTREKHLFVVKPMNCPHHIEIFSRKLWSYRELPVRYATTTKVYRDEQTGELSGLSRVRSITQDDAHAFCRTNQVQEEAKKIWEIITEFYSAFGFTLSPRLSLHDPKAMEKYLGDKKTWNEAEEQLKDLAEEQNSKAPEVLGEAAFYGPKIDFMAKDSLGREWQVATIQLDFNMPKNFELNCINEKGEKEQIVMLHAAIMGSIERFISILIEHFAGAFPFWLSPVQIKILTVSENHKKFGIEIFEELKRENIRAELDDTDETLGKKVRNVKLEKVPFWIVIGDKEVNENKYKLESRDKGDLGEVNKEDLMSVLEKERKV